MKPKNIYIYLILLASANCFAFDHHYNLNAKIEPSTNDIKAFVYHWFAGFDHQVDINYFLPFLPKNNLDIHYPDTDIKTRNDFMNWYQNVENNIEWNVHDISHLKIKGDEAHGWHLSMDIDWFGMTYSGHYLKMKLHQDWDVDGGMQGLVIEKLVTTTFT